MANPRLLILSAAVALAAIGACGGDATQSQSSGGAGGSSASSGQGPTTSTGGPGSTSGSTVASSASGTGGSSSTGGSGPVGSCSDAPPPGATLAAAIPSYSGGVCPMLVQGPNMIMSKGNQRSFILAAPSMIDPNKPLPVVFLWHWLGGSAQAFYDKGDVANAVETQYFIAVLPEKKGDLQFTWPFNITDSQARMDEEFTFFDDLLACVGAQYNVNKECVSTAGVSAGALFTDQLASARSDHLASMISLSGGVDDNIIKPWGHPAHHMPAIVLWGGPTDNCFGLLSFETASKSLEDGLTQDGNFFIECVHNCGHAAPPFTAPMGLSTYAGLWQFTFDHPFWLGAGQSPYLQSGLNPGLPMWCGIGKGSATPRTGACPDPPGC